MFSEIYSTLDKMPVSDIHLGTFKCKINSFNISNFEKIDDSINKDNILMSDDNKLIWIPYRSGIYNQFVECFPFLIESFLHNKKYEYVVIIKNTNQHFVAKEDEMHMNFINKVMTDLGIKFFIYETDKDEVFINNFCILHYTTSNQKKIIQQEKDIFYKYVKDKNKKPFRKVYLSRKHIEPRHYFWIKDGLSTRTDDRLIDEEVFELFLIKNGFEIIVPEKKFNNFIDQINYMYEVQTLVSLSSSGITNSIFMQPNTKVVEIVTGYPGTYENFTENKKIEEKSFEGFESLHLLYVVLSYLNNNIHISIPNHTRLSQDVIKIFLNSNIMEGIK